MKEKYYTPKIEEFYIGFKYEIMSMENAQWGSYTLKDGNDLITLIMRDQDERRVKYLDREDIESFGFHTEDNGECYNKSIGWMIIGIYPWSDINGKDHEYKISIDMNTIFHGIIKNKSELQRLLSQLNIK